MQKLIRIFKQPLWQMGFVLFISTLIIFKAGNCFSNDNIIPNSSYKFLCLLYEDEEEICKRQLEQLRLINEQLMKKIKADYKKQQAQVKDRRCQEKMLIKNIKNFYYYIDNYGNSYTLKK